MSEIIDVLGEEVDAAVDTPLVVIEGTKGDPGKDGVSPTVSTAATTGGTKVTITDAKGSHEFVVKDGSDATVTAANIEAAMGYKPADPTKYLPLTGGNLTGNLDGKYITGTWLRSTDAGHQEAAATKVAVLDAQGWIYYRTPAELMADMGLADGTEVSY